MSLKKLNTSVPEGNNPSFKPLTLFHLMRYIDLGTITPEESASIDKTIFEARNKGLVEDTLHIYFRDRPTISLGRFRNMDTDLYPLPENISIIRRISGGSTILTGPDQLIFAVTLGEKIPNRNDSFKIICNGIIRALAHLNINAEYKPVNDVLVAGKKISGSAQYRNSNCMMQHGTLLIKTPSIDEVLRPVKHSTYNGLTSICDLLGHIPERSKIINAVSLGFAEALNTTMEQSTLSQWEKDRAEALKKEVLDL